jgi:hypothetical protein
VVDREDRHDDDVTAGDPETLGIGASLDEAVRGAGVGSPTAELASPDGLAELGHED